MITITHTETKVDVTAEELAQLPAAILEKLGWHARGTGAATNVTSEVTSGEGPVEADVTPEMVHRLLTYKPLRPNQKALLGVLYRANDWIGAEEISDAMGITRKRLTGVMGGLGLRSNAVRGWPRRRDTGVPPTRFLWDYERREEDEFYRLKSVLRKVIGDLAILNGSRRR
jgi:hypothetical protein